MECNKGEAIRAKEISETKLFAKDFAGAKKFALKAQSLYPNLDGISQLLAVIDVDIAAEVRINGESDWYGILGLNQCSDNDTVKKQYRKLLLMLHPDKNKSVGADGAYKHISEAWALLSDETKKSAYDNRRFPRATQKKVASQGSPAPWANKSSIHVGPKTAPANSRSAPHGSTSFSSFTNNTNPLRPDKCSNHVDPTTAPAKSRSPKMRFPRATQKKVASQGSPAPCANKSSIHVGPKTAPANSKSAPHGSTDFSSFTNNTNPLRPDEGSNHVGPTTSPAKPRSPNMRFPRATEKKVASQGSPAPRANKSSPAKSISPPCTFWTACEKCKMLHEHARLYKNCIVKCSKCQEYFKAVETSARPESQSSQQFHNLNKTPPGVSAEGQMGFTSQDSFQTNVDCEPFSRMAGPTPSAFAQVVNNFQQANERDKREREADAAVQEPLFQRKHSTTDSHPDLKGDKPVKRRRRIDNGGGNRHGGITANRMGVDRTRDLSRLELRNMLMDKGKREVRNKVQEWNLAASAKATKKLNVEDKETVATNGESYGHNKSSIKIQEKEAVHEDPDAEALESVSISVPDPDFHDFDVERSERSFGEKQIWAAYDDDDGMPRYYTMIQRVVSLNPFQMRIGWLNPQSNSELGLVTWTKSGFSKICGDFRVGKYETSNSLNSFSHKVKCTKGAKGCIQIYPSKGDVWALYRNWSNDWDEHTSDEVKHKYDMVEVVDDYSEEKGVSVTPLVKAEGFKTVYRHVDPPEVRTIPRNEMVRFSHQVPSYLLTGKEGENAPQGCLELDPAATPTELLQVTTESKKQETEEVDEEKSGG